jgi:citrate lyase subunit beta / citryl-CoA lyase
MSTRRPPHLRRSWVFLPGADRAAHETGAASGADVLIQELEDFTPPEQRPQARALAATLYEAWRARGIVAAVRINPLETAGREDLAAVMRGRPDVVLMSKVAEPEQVRALAAAIEQHERGLGIACGSTELVPNIESARGVMQTYAIATADPRVTGACGSTEDMAADLGAPRTRQAHELAYVRQRLHVECVAARVLSIDCPYTFADDEGCTADARFAHGLGYKAKSAVKPEHARLVNAVMTPSDSEVISAQRMVRAFEEARGRGLDRIAVDGQLVEVPMYLNAQRVLERASALGVA